MPHLIEMQRLLDSLPPYVSDDPSALACGASLLYARCRWQGFAVRSPNECLVAAYAIEADEPLLARDRNFVQIAHIEPKPKLT